MPQYKFFDMPGGLGDHALAEDCGYFGAPLPKDCTKKRWLEYLDQLKIVAQKLDDIRGDHDAKGKDITFEREKLNWEIGDYLVRGKDAKFEEPARTRRRLSKVFKIADGTLSNYMTTCDVFRDFSRRRENLSFSHHLAVAKRKLTREEQEAWLDRAEGVRRDENGKKIPDTGYYRGGIAARKLAKEVSRDPSGKKIDNPTHEVIKLTIPISWYNDLTKLTAIMPESRGHVGRLICLLADKYIKEHRTELDAAVKAWNEGAPARKEASEKEWQEIRMRMEEFRLADEEARKARKASQLEENKRKNEERKLAGLPTDEQFEGYKKRLAYICRPIINSIPLGKVSINFPVTIFLCSRLGIKHQREFREVPCDRWEATLAMMEAADPAELREMVKSPNHPPAKVETTA